MNSELELVCDLRRLLLYRAESGHAPLNLAVAESLTCGRVQAAIGAGAGASQFFLGGVTAYTGEQKVALLGVSRAEGEAVNWVSAAVAEQMARGAAQLFGSELSLATTGYAEPAPEQGVHVPFAWWALAQRVRGNFAGVSRDATAEFFVRSERVACPDCSRVEVQKAVTAAALIGLCEHLRACSQNETGRQKAACTTKPVE